MLVLLQINKISAELFLIEYAKFAGAESFTHCTLALN